MTQRRNRMVRDYSWRGPGDFQGEQGASTRTRGRRKPILVTQATQHRLHAHERTRHQRGFTLIASPETLLESFASFSDEDQKLIFWNVNDCNISALCFDGQIVRQLVCGDEQGLW